MTWKGFSSSTTHISLRGKNPERSRRNRPGEVPPARLFLPRTQDSPIIPTSGSNRSIPLPKVNCVTLVYRSIKGLIAAEAMTFGPEGSITHVAVAYSLLTVNPEEVSLAFFCEMSKIDMTVPITWLADRTGNNPNGNALEKRGVACSQTCIG